MPQYSSSTCRSEKRLLVLRGLHLQEIAFVAALVETGAALRVPDHGIFGLLQLEVIHEELLIHVAAVKDELMDGDGKEGARQLLYSRLGKVLQVLAGKEQGGFLFPHPLEGVADVGDDGGIGQPQVQLINSRYGICLLYTSPSPRDTR